MAGIVRVDRRLYFDTGAKKLSEDPPGEGYLWAPGPGFEVPEEEAERLGYKPDPKAAKAAPERRAKDAATPPDIGQYDTDKPTEAATKAAPKPADKMIGKPADKNR